MRLLTRRHLMKLAFALPMTMALATGHAAEEFPNRYIKLIVPLAPGGGGDLVARVVAAKMEESTPPDSVNPTGTSERKRSLHASVSVSFSSKI